MTKKKRFRKLMGFIQDNTCESGDLEGVMDLSEIEDMLNKLNDENYKIKSLLLKKVEELNDDYNKSARAGMPTGAIIGELDSFEGICRMMEWIE